MSRQEGTWPSSPTPLSFVHTAFSRPTSALSASGNGDGGNEQQADEGKLTEVFHVVLIMDALSREMVAGKVF